MTVHKIMTPPPHHEPEAEAPVLLSPFIIIPWQLDGEDGNEDEGGGGGGASKMAAVPTWRR